MCPVKAIPSGILAVGMRSRRSRGREAEREKTMISGSIIEFWSSGRRRPINRTRNIITRYYIRTYYGEGIIKVRLVSTPEISRFRITTPGTLETKKKKQTTENPFNVRYYLHADCTFRSFGPSILLYVFSRTHTQGIQSNKIDF